MPVLPPAHASAPHAHARPRLQLHHPARPCSCVRSEERACLDYVQVLSNYAIHVRSLYDEPASLPLSELGSGAHGTALQARRSQLASCGTAPEAGANFVVGDEEQGLGEAGSRGVGQPGGGAGSSGRGGDRGPLGPVAEGTEGGSWRWGHGERDMLVNPLADPHLRDAGAQVAGRQPPSLTSCFNNSVFQVRQQLLQQLSVPGAPGCSGHVGMSMGAHACMPIPQSGARPSTAA